MSHLATKSGTLSGVFGTLSRICQTLVFLFSDCFKKIPKTHFAKCTTPVTLVTLRAYF